MIRTHVSDALTVPHLCTELKPKAMKKLVPLIGLLVLCSSFSWAQSDHLHVTGYVTDANGAAVHGQMVCVSYAGDNPAIADSTCGYTNANGWFSIVVENGSMTGPNQTFEVNTYESCQGLTVQHSETVSNGQGSVDAVEVNFELGCGSNTGNCNCQAVVTFVEDPNGLHHFAADVPCGTHPFQYQWWIDGHVSTVAAPTHQFTEDGIYGVCVTVADANGCSFTACDSVHIGLASCTAYWYYSSTPNGTIQAGVDNHFWFSGSASNSAHFSWTAQGNGLSLSSHVMNPVFNFPAAGTYNVCLTVIDSLTMCYDDYCADVVVTNGNTGGCQAYFTSEVNGTGPGWAAHFTDQSAGTYDNWLWEFGDGHYSFDENPAHTYTQPGTYQVCLTVIDSLNNQCYDDYCTLLVVGDTSVDSCDASFTFSGPTPISNTYQFAANDGNTVNAFSWDFGDGHSGSGPYVSHTYSMTSGSVNVCLTSYSSNTDTCTTCQTITFGQNSCEGYLSGQVFAGTQNQPVDGAIVYLITYDENTGMLAAMQATVTDSSGHYHFAPVACGDYLIKAAAGQNTMYYTGYLPTYYGNSLFWEYAQDVTVDAVMPGVQYDITLIAGNNPGGPGFIGGSVLDGANKTEADGGPLEGVNVMLFDLQGNTIAYTYTDVNGEFFFDNLAYGGYQVYAEMLNHTTIPAVVNISAENPSAEGLTIYVSDELISTGIAQIDFESLIGGVYPNPVSDMAALNLSLEGSHMVNLTIVDLTGRVIGTETVSLMPGINTHRFDVAGLSGGYYMLNISETGGAFNITRRFIVNR